MTKQEKNKNTIKEKESQTLSKQEYTKEEKERIANYEKRLKKVPPKLEQWKEDSKTMCWVQINDPKLAGVTMMEAFGTADHKLQSFFLDQVVQTFKGCVSVEGINEDALEAFANNTLSLLQGIAPKDEVEGMLAVQMIGAHNMAMAIMNRAMITEQTSEGRQAGVNQATKLLRTYTSQMEALKKYRTGGQQKVTVKHVHVNEGGKAIVGTVNKGGGGSNEN